MICTSRRWLPLEVCRPRVAHGVTRRRGSEALVAKETPPTRGNRGAARLWVEFSPNSLVPLHRGFDRLLVPWLQFG